MAIAAVKLEEDSAPFDIPQVPLKFDEFENFQRGVLKWPEYRRFEMRGRISNVLLGRNQHPTPADMVIAERLYQNGVLRKYEYCLEWQQSSSDRQRFLRVHVKEAGEHVPTYCAFGQIQIAVTFNDVGYDIQIFQHLTQEVVEDFHGYRVFDNCLGANYNCLGWSYVKSLSRDVRLWAGEKAGAYYGAFVNYVEQLIDRKVVQNFEVILTPRDDSGVRLQVKAHRGGVQLAGFTTVAEFDEVLYKEQHQHAG
jgi:hypothetical protein